MHKRLIKLWFFLLLCTTFNAALAQSFNGKTQWFNTVDISSYSSSSVKSIAVINGQKVKKGDPLILMDDTLLKLDVDIAQANLLAKEPNKDKLEMDYNRALELYDRTLISDVTLKTAEFEFTQAKAEYEKAEAVLAKADFLLNKATIKSPINGRVLHINTALGFYSDTEISKSLITLVDDTKMYAVANLKVSQWNNNLVGKKASIMINKKRYSGMVQSLSLLPVDKLNGLSVYPIVVEFDTQLLLPEGMPLTINIK